MNELITALDQLAETPQAISRIRELILQLAVQGRLVEQDPNDEPAYNMFKPLIKEQQMLNIDVRSSINKEHTKFQIPPSWIWVSLDDIVVYDAGSKHDPNNLDPDSWLLELEDIEKNTSVILGQFLVKERKPKSNKASFQKNDILYGKLRPYLNKVIVAHTSGFCTTEIVVLRPKLELSPFYIQNFLKSPFFVSYVNQHSYGTKMPRLGTLDGKKASIPLPPLAEQQRIVAKVAQLMALCDQLEQQQTSREALRQQVQQSAIKQLLSELARPADAQQIAQPSQPERQTSLFTRPTLANQPIEPLADDGLSISSEQQLFFEQFDDLHTTPKAIGQLRELILQLAVQGRLVAQNPSDEPASILLERIQAEKQRLIAAGQLKPEKALTPIAASELPFGLPKG
ncbi:restriction modification system DNA specificity domain [Herpetosiphon aurantiacus DSM 785]|uniref:Restriction modification system DNA specificity domain n=2 Tax=Herpetosiphon TaxID=64 RepID=A9B1P4_HERA2|nr:restriction modification system DNA specificity domain [Herpetosiphon aurantiacus DSM 785]